MCVPQAADATTKGGARAARGGLCVRRPSPTGYTHKINAAATACIRSLLYDALLVAMMLQQA